MKSFKFPARERLKSQKTIAQLFKGGESFGMYPLRLVWTKQAPAPNGSSIQSAFSVSKRNFPRAVDRNLLKRQLRESFRLHKHLLQPSAEAYYALMWLYTAKDIQPFAVIEKKMRQAVQRFAAVIVEG